MKMIFIIPIAISCLIACKSNKDTLPPTPPATDTTVYASTAFIADTACTLGLVFCSKFEETTWRSVWDDYDGNPAPINQVIVNNGPFNIAGNHVMQLRVPAGRGGADLVKVFPQTYDKLYARWYEYWEPGYDFNAANHGSSLAAGDRNFLGQSGIRPNGSDFASSGFEPQVSGNYTGVPALYTYYRGMYQDCVDPNGQCWGDHFPCFVGSNYCTNPDHVTQSSKQPPVLKTGRWYRIELMIDMGAPVTNAADANGVLNFWIDGVEYGPWNKMWFRTSADLKLSILSLALFHHGQHSTKGVLIDNVAVSVNKL